MIIPVSADSKNYDIVLESGALGHLSDFIDADRRSFIVTDSGVPAEYAAKVSSFFKSSVIVTIPCGEQSKSIESFCSIMGEMLKNGFTRSDCVVAVGGGVVGDLSGFCAACYMRGIGFYNIPTTLLSQVDSSIGGKTAIDFNGVKNSVGAFYQPEKVIIDPDTLKTLDPRQVRAGLAEIIKMAATFDRSLFEFIEASSDITDDIFEIIRRSLLIKREVIEKDPRETGLRKSLNFGHTIGHGIESAGKGELLHGECVAMGMLPMSSGDAEKRLRALLRKCGLETSIPFEKELLMSYIAHDKKAAGDGISCVVCRDIGSFELKTMTLSEICERIDGIR